MILSYPGLFKNIPHVWFLRLYSFIKIRNMIFRKFIRFGRDRLPLALNVQESPFHSCLFFASCLVFCNLFCKLPQNWEVWVHLCWNFPTFSFEVVVFRMYCCSFINFHDVPHNCQHKRAGERKKTFNNMENSIVNVWYTQILVTFQCSI